MRVIFCLVITLFSLQNLLSQSISTRNNYTGTWKNPESWDPVWNNPSYIISDHDIYINGYITADSSLVISGPPSTLFINDTLEIHGNLYLGNNNILQIQSGGILIVHGNLTVINKTELHTGGYLIVDGDFIDVSNQYGGSFSSTNTPSRVFICGNVPEIADADYPVLNCTGSESTSYAHSGCNYGDLTDLQIDPVYKFFGQTCDLDVQVSVNDPVCAGDIISLRATGGKSWSWTGPSGFASTEQNPLILQASAGISGIYKVKAFEHIGCTDSGSVNVTVRGYTLADAGPDQELQNEFSTQMNAILPSDATGQWTVISGTAMFEQPESPVTRVTGLSADTNTFRWQISVGSCTISDEVIIAVNRRFIPSVITPNNDNKNQYFIPRGLKDPFELVVFDRSGKLVYAQKSYENNWDGHSNDNKELPEDTYFYIIRTADGQVIKGSILIKR